MAEATAAAVNAIHQHDPYDWAPLNAWNQSAPRCYNRIVLCFDVDNEKHEYAIAHLRSCVAKLNQEYPVLRSLLKLNVPIVHISKPVQHYIPVEVCDFKKSIADSYASLKNRGFPASDFVNDVFDVPAKDIAPALIIRIYIMDGGLLLGIHLHHSLGDGKAIDDIVTWLSAKTRGNVDAPRTISLSSPFCEANYASEDGSKGDAMTQEDIKENFPERMLLSSSLSSLPTEKYTGKIFLFDVATLSKLQSCLQQRDNVQRPSTTVILDAFVWAHATRARLAASSGVNKGSPTAGEQIEQSRLFTIVDTRERAFDKKQAEKYFGNAADVALGSLPTTELLDLCEISASTDFRALAEKLEPIIRCIQKSIKAVNKEFAAARHKLYSCFSDPRELTIDYSPADKQAWMFNAWRYFCMNNNQTWNITDQNRTVFPDRVRRAGGEWNTPAAMLLPTPRESKQLELMLTMEESAMDLLLEDKAFTSLGKEVITDDAVKGLSGDVVLLEEANLP